VHEILRSLPSSSFVLDLGCAGGSFASDDTQAVVVRLDLAFPDDSTDGLFVRGDASQLPFPNDAVSAVISNHSLEHFPNLDSCLDEIGRVIGKDGSLFVAVPDASTLTDRIYRWLGRGGGHVNPFTSPSYLALHIQERTGLPHVATRTLCSSLSFLNRRMTAHPLPRRALLLGGGTETSLFWFGLLSRFLDRQVHTRFSVYGWAFYFGNVPAASIDLTTWRNVCLRCGSGHPASSLTVGKFLRFLRVYQCPECGAVNPFTADDF
jgi:SAM-dependent methyltransferase